MDFKRFLVRFVRDEAGQSTTEYILILSVVAMVAIRFKTLLTSKLESLMGKVGENMDKAAEQ